MLERLLIQNFQAHDKLIVDFAPGVTCIVGPSDAGKSAIIRALRWLVTNQPGGDAFVRHGTKGCTVKLVVDGHTITRRRSPGGGINEYQLDGSEYRAFGRDVPEPVVSLLNMAPVCWQGQHDAPYWFAETAGEVSRQLNAIVNLGVIDDALTSIGSTQRKARAALEAAETHLATAKARYDELNWVPEYESAVQSVEAAFDLYNSTKNRANNAAVTVQAVRQHRATFTGAHAAAKLGHAAICAGTRALQVQGQACLLGQLVVRVRGLAAQLTAPVPPIHDVETAYSKYSQAVAHGKAIQAIISDVRDKEAALCRAEKELEAATKAVPKRCPTCGQSL